MSSQDMADMLYHPSIGRVRPNPEWQVMPRKFMGLECIEEQHLYILVGVFRDYLLKVVMDLDRRLLSHGWSSEMRTYRIAKVIDNVVQAQPYGRPHEVKYYGRFERMVPVNELKRDEKEAYQYALKRIFFGFGWVIGGMNRKLLEHCDLIKELKVMCWVLAKLFNTDHPIPYRRWDEVIRERALEHFARMADAAPMLLEDQKITKAPPNPFIGQPRPKPRMSSIDTPKGGMEPSVAVGYDHKAWTDHPKAEIKATTEYDFEATRKCMDLVEGGYKSYQKWKKSQG